MKKVLILFSVLLAFSSNALAQITRSEEVVQARSADAVQTVFVQPMVMETERVLVQGADEIGKVTYTYKLRKKDYRKHFGGTLENLKAYTVYKASQEYGVDAFAASLFYFKMENNDCLLVLTGFPIRYKKMRKATDPDYEWMGLLSPLPQIVTNAPVKRFIP